MVCILFWIGSSRKSWERQLRYCPFLVVNFFFPIFHYVTSIIFWVIVIRPIIVEKYSFIINSIKIMTIVKVTGLSDIYVFNGNLLMNEM